MLLVGGGILVHGVPLLEHGVGLFIHGVTDNTLLQGALGLGLNLLAGIVLGLFAYPVFLLLEKVFRWAKQRAGALSLSKVGSGTGSHDLATHGPAQERYAESG